MEDRMINIWFIDDEEANHVISSTIVSKCGLSGIDLTFYSNPEVAFQNLSNAENFPDFIFLDVMMPILTGWEFLAKLNTLQNYPVHKVKICLLSSSLSCEDLKQKCKYSEIIGYLEKPLNIEKFSSIIKS